MSQWLSRSLPKGRVSLGVISQSHNLVLWRKNGEFKGARAVPWGNWNQIEIPGGIHFRSSTLTVILFSSFSLG